MSWDQIALDAFKAAQTLKRFPRSCMSRAYYASYAAATHYLEGEKTVSFPLGRDGPGHEQLPNLVGTHLAGRFDLNALKLVKAALRRLYSARVQADYKRDAKLTHMEATQALLDANTVLLKLALL